MLIQAPGATFQADERDAAFWDGVNAGTWEPETFRVLRDNLRPGSRFVDCGVWIGPTALYAAAIGAEVDGFECDPVALDRFERNLQLNPELSGRIRLSPFGLGVEDGEVPLYSSALGNSESSLLGVHERGGGPQHLEARATVSVRRARDVFAERGYLQDPHTLIKMDVEGAEFAILDDLADLIETAVCRFYISFHPLNVAALPDRPPQLARLQKTLRWMEIFWRRRWLWPQGDLVVDKEEMLARVLSGRMGYVNLLFTREDDADGT